MVLHDIYYILKDKLNMTDDEININNFNKIREKKDYIDVLSNISYNSKYNLLICFKNEFTDNERYHIFKDCWDNKFQELFKKILEKKI